MWSSVFLTDPRQTLEASPVPLNAEGFRGNNQCNARESEADERSEIVKRLDFKAMWQKGINSGFRETDRPH